MVLVVIAFPRGRHGDGWIDILAHLKEGDSRLPHRCRVRLRAGSRFAALCGDSASFSISPAKQCG
ncbi:hypothetical protein ACFQ9Z_33880 [Streptomyces sp. NPDC056580]|uniref:hypothetical protein n=1 Tax=Streptomyces sp. NPDC056580 TaxID=3345872 RepID=UPI0036945949